MKNNNFLNKDNNTSCIDDDLLKFVQTKAFMTEVNNSLSNTENGKKITTNKNLINNKEEANKITDKKIQNSNLQEAVIDEKLQTNPKAIEFKDFLNNIYVFLKELTNKLQIKEEISSQLINELQLFMVSLLESSEQEELQQKKLLCFHLKKLLGNSFKNKIFLIKRASSWLNLGNLDSNEGYLNFLYKMIELGSLISEDQGIRNEQNSTLLSKEEAKRQRNLLISDEKFKQALTNKSHTLHKDALNKLRSLNSIIVS